MDKARGGAGIREQIDGALPELMDVAQPAAIGVGFGGPVDSATGQICCSHQIEGWSEFPSATGCAPHRPARDRGQRREHGGARRSQMRCGQDCNPVFYVTLGSGVGGGLLVDGSIYQGARPGEAEIG